VVLEVSHDDAVVLSPALDGGYTPIGLSRPHAEVFAGIPRSTPGVYRCSDRGMVPASVLAPSLLLDRLSSART
jgi:glycosyltransferase A (GT-A) superfamily protein (DUF2064 family)